jgi:hypothetical protein
VGNLVDIPASKVYIGVMAEGEPPKNLPRAELQKENMPIDVMKSRKSAEPDNKPKLKVSARRDPPLRDLGCKDVGDPVPIMTAAETSRCTHTSSISVFVDEEFAHHDYFGVLPDTGGVQDLQATESGKPQDENTNAGVTLPEAISELSSGHHATVQLLTRRLAEMRTFRSHLAKKDVQAATKAVSSGQDCWSQREVACFRSVLRKAGANFTDHDVGTIR